MIELSANTAVMLYLCLTLVTVLGLWLSHHYRSKRKKILSFDHELHVCEYCHCVYLEEDIKDVTQCPQCKLFNKNNKYKRI